MSVGAVELGWIVSIGFAALFAGELALSAYISKVADGGSVTLNDRDL